MTQRPVGEIELVTARGRAPVPFSDHNLYHEGVRMFRAATAGNGQPAATGQDGIHSLAVALAVREAARSGTRVTVRTGA
jgi:1,5-anhydro-D-fructose reductase (1,5-anhydro-D-mannitol-forming)